MLGSTRRRDALRGHSTSKSSGRDGRADFADPPEALENSVEIARRCSLGHAQQNYLPLFPTPRVRAVDDHPCQQSAKGSELQPAAALPGPGARAVQRPQYVERLRIRIDTIQKMGFPGYFLIVADFIQWARSAAYRSAPAGVPAPVR